MPYPTTDKIVDLRIAHLNMIQNVISRMSGFSASAKNFCITINAVIIAGTFEREVPWIELGAMLVVALFCLMDSYYLSLERRYRELFEDVAARPLDATPDLSLKASPLTWRCFGGSITSTSVFPFYLLLMASMAGLLYLANDVQLAPSEPVAASPSSAVGPETACVSTRSGVDGCRSKDVPAQRTREPVPASKTNAASVGEPVRSR